MGGQAGGRGGRAVGPYSLRSPERGDGWAPWRARVREFTGPSGKNHSLSFKMSLTIVFDSLSIGRPSALARSIATTILALQLQGQAVATKGLRRQALYCLLLTIVARSGSIARFALTSLWRTISGWFTSCFRFFLICFSSLSARRQASWPRS
jgi:hypothetical protein